MAARLLVPGRRATPEPLRESVYSALHTGAQEHVDPLRDEGEAYAEMLSAAGVPVSRVRHDVRIPGFVYMGGVLPAPAAVAVDGGVGRFRGCTADDHARRERRIGVA